MASPQPSSRLCPGGTGPIPHHLSGATCRLAFCCHLAMSFCITQYVWRVGLRLDVHQSHSSRIAPSYISAITFFWALFEHFLSNCGLCIGMVKPPPTSLPSFHQPLHTGPGIFFWSRECPANTATDPLTTWLELAKVALPQTTHPHFYLFDLSNSFPPTNQTASVIPISQSLTTTDW